MTHDVLPIGNSEELWYALLTSIKDLGGTATAEDLRPMVREALGLPPQVMTKLYESYHPIISNALIQMAANGLLERPFGYGSSLDEAGRRRWFARNRSRQKVQMVWQLTDNGHSWIKQVAAAGEHLVRVRREPQIHRQVYVPPVSDIPKERPVTSPSGNEDEAMITKPSLACNTALPEPGKRFTTAELIEKAGVEGTCAGLWPENEDITPETIAYLHSREERYAESGVFDPKNTSDGRERTLAAIVRRRGQPEFRRQLLAIYSARCIITGSDAEPALEAAHITPYRGVETNHPSNGLLLRADIHTLFDLKLLTIEPSTATVLLAPSLLSSSYAALHGTKLALPATERGGPSREALAAHHAEFAEVLAVRNN